MSRYSPQVLPRRKATLADALAEGAEGFMQGMQMKQAQGNRDREFELREEEVGDRRRRADAATDRQRATDASEGLMYDPEGTYGQTPELEFQLPASQGMPVSPVSRIPAGRRQDVRDLGGGYTLDPKLTREGRAATLRQSESERLAQALEAGGLEPGVARAGAAMPSALPFLVPREREAMIPTWQREGYPSFAAWRSDRMAGRGRGGAVRLGGGSAANGMEDMDPDFLPGMSALDAGRVVQDYDRETDQVGGFADALAPADSYERTDLLEAGGADSARVARSDSLRGVVGERIQQRPTVPGLMRPRMRGVSSGGSTSDTAAQRWEQLVAGGMPKEQATAQVQREMGR